MCRSQNDSVVQDIKIGRDSIELTVNHYDVERLASMLKPKPINWDILGTAFPVIYRFDGVSELQVLRAVEHGALQHFRSSFRRLNGRLSGISYIHVLNCSAASISCIFAVNGGTWFSRGKKVQLTEFFDEYYLCIEAANLTIEDRHREGWLKAFGPEQMAILDRFESVWPVPNWSVPDFETFLESSSDHE